MPVAETSSTFEYCRDWLVSSDLFVRDAMQADALSIDDARDQARARIHPQEALDESNEDEVDDGDTLDPPAIAPPPRSVIIMRANTRKRLGTATWGGSGQLLVTVEVLVPEEYRIVRPDDKPAVRLEKFAARKLWGTRLCEQIRLELLATSGKGDANGTPYLNATDVNVFLEPSDPEEGEAVDFIGFIYEVEWR
jgi:hypothetical protein